MNLRIGSSVAVIVVGLICGCSDGGQTAQMNPGTAADGADAAKAGLNATTDMKGTMAPGKATAPAAK